VSVIRQVKLELTNELRTAQPVLRMAATPENNMPKVYVRKIGRQSIEEAVMKFLDEIRYTPAKNKIFIKPNICGFYKPDSPCIVNPKVVGGIIEYLKKIKITDITVGESPIPSDVNKVFEVTGYRRMAKKYNVALLDLNKAKKAAVSLPDFNLFLPKFLLEKECEYINVSKIKTHIQTAVSLCVKNQKGLLDFPGKRNMHITGDLHENIRLLSEKIQPDFCIVDGTNALEGFGPGATGTEVKNLGLIVMGRDMYAVDRTCCRIMGINPDLVKHLRNDTDRCEVDGLTHVQIKKSFFFPKVKCFRKLKFHMWITDKTCSGCSNLMGELKKEAFRNFKLFRKILKFTLLQRLDILSGNSCLPPRHGRVILLGNCMKGAAEKNKLCFIAGCPPTADKLIEAILKLDGDDKPI